MKDAVVRVNPESAGFAMRIIVRGGLGALAGELETTVVADVVVCLSRRDAAATSARAANPDGVLVTLQPVLYLQPRHS